MHLKTLRVTGFRNLAGQELAFGTGLHWISGANGQGKTNLLEAIHYACMAKSHRPSREHDMLGFASDAALVEARAEKGGLPVEVSIGFNRAGEKKIVLNGRNIRRASDYLGTLNAVSFSPDDIGMVRGEPAQRRLFLDLLLSQTDPLYLSALQDFRFHLLQRNALLKSDRGEDTVLLQTYTEKIAVSGAIIIQRRMQALAVLDAAAQKLFAALTREFGALALSYRVSFPLPETMPLEAEYRAVLCRNARREQEFHTTLFGPHRDDLAITLAGLDLRRFGSQGQCRAAALAVKLAAVAYVQQACGEAPLLILDDIFSELDEVLSGNLVKLISNTSQIFLAAPFFNQAERAGKQLCVNQGIIREVPLLP